MSGKLTCGYAFEFAQLNSQDSKIWIYFPEICMDEEAPQITEINTKNNLSEWSQTKTITISGTENYCNTVNIQILDDTGNTIYKGFSTVTNNQYSINYTPENEINTEGKTFTVIISDNCENSTTQEFTISKIDGIAPKPISENQIEENWKKSKVFTFKATDQGIGNVQIAFNDIQDLKQATLNENGEYERTYEFTGEIYTPKELSVLYKDELGNSSIQKITINKIDNTSPTITVAQINNNKLSIEANDIKEDLGEGSGIAKYKYITSSSKLENPVITEENKTEVLVTENITIPEIYKVKYIYIIAEDLVGNISDVYEFEVPGLTLTSKVNTSSVNGKGAIDLDWSGYDTTNKYFVIYRKKENETEWKTIVPLQQKLTGEKYTDILGNDLEKPNVPIINIEKNQENNNIQIAQEENTDTGTTYSYYIESYDSTDLSLLSTSQLKRRILTLI